MKTPFWKYDFRGVPKCACPFLLYRKMFVK